MPAPKVLLTTTVAWPSAARLAGAFADCGCVVAALFPSGHALGKSRHVARASRYRPLGRARSLDAAVAQMAPDLIVPCDDRALRHMLEIWNRGHSRKDRPTLARLERSLGAPSVYPSLFARADFIAAARALGIRAPETHAVATESDILTVAGALDFPVVLKTDNSWGGDGVMVVETPVDVRAAFARLARKPSFARSVYRAFARRDLHHAVEAMGKGERRVSVQAFVSGAPATSVIACWEGEVVAAHHFDVLATSTAQGPATVVRRVEDRDMGEAARRIARHFRLSGFIGLDFMRDHEGRVHLIEINPRATPTAHLALGAGRDLVGAIVSRLDADRAHERPCVTRNDTIALFPQEWARDPLSAHLRTAYHDLPFDDPALMPDGQFARPPRRLAASPVPTS